MALTQKYLLGAYFDVCVQLHNKSIGKGKANHCIGKQI
jgi:hypothetical protein